MSIDLPAALTSRPFASAVKSSKTSPTRRWVGISAAPLAVPRVPALLAVLLVFAVIAASPRTGRAPTTDRPAPPRRLSAANFRPGNGPPALLVHRSPSPTTAEQHFSDDAPRPADQRVFPIRPGQYRWQRGGRRARQDGHRHAATANRLPPDGFDRIRDDGTARVRFRWWISRGTVIWTRVFEHQGRRGPFGRRRSLVRRIGRHF